jgi:hypothetical protein
MLCPTCYSEECRRSHREDTRDFLLGVTGLRPWRCGDCETRFFAWSVAAELVFYVHCERCGNLRVKRISSEHVSGHFAGLLRTLRLPAYRCGPCRNKFFSIRRQLRVAPAPQESETEAESAAAPES